MCTRQDYENIKELWPYLKKRSIHDNLRQLVLIKQDRVLLN